MSPLIHVHLMHLCYNVHVWYNVHLWCITTALPLSPLSLPLAHDMWMHQHLCGHTLTDKTHVCDAPWLTPDARSSSCGVQCVKECLANNILQRRRTSNTLSMSFKECQSMSCKECQSMSCLSLSLLDLAAHRKKKLDKNTLDQRTSDERIRFDRCGKGKTLEIKSSLKLQRVPTAMDRKVPTDL